jgi:sporulation protein YlmC with PRC-barrel domain
MDIPMNAEVRCNDEVCGTSFCVIVNPIDDQVTHIVVEGSSFPQVKRLVPIDMIKEASPDMIQLNCDIYRFDTLPEFIQSEFIIPDPYGGTQNIPNTMLMPYAMVMGTVTREHEQIPPHELAIHRGAHVIAADGRVGKVDEFLVEPKSGCITHLVLREGHLWGKKEICIPVSQIDRIEKDLVYLKLKKQDVEQLPPLPVKRSGWQ